MATTLSKSEPAKDNRKATKLLLACGVVAGPLFIGMSLIQALARQGFNLTHHAISLLLLGNLGWLQFTNFVVTGLLAVAYAYGMRRSLHPGRDGTWGPLLVGAYGVALIIAGIFHPDPEFGFPAGAPAGVPSAVSGHAIMHNIAFFALVLSLVAACFVFARRFGVGGHRGWAAYCVASGVSAPALLVLGIALTPSARGGLSLLGVAVVTSAWIAVVAAQLLAERNLEGSRSERGSGRLPMGEPAPLYMRRGNQVPEKFPSLDAQEP